MVNDLAITIKTGHRGWATKKEGKFGLRLMPARTEQASSGGVCRLWFLLRLQLPG
jgi:hypothetical protein